MIFLLLNMSISYITFERYNIYLLHKP